MNTKMNNKISVLRLIILLLIFANINLSAKNKAAYMIPDIGAPGMNVYIEIIAEVDSIGAFGEDGVLYDTPTSESLCLKTINASDAQKVTFGPLTVSWNGRLISSQIFVNPNLTPESWRWNEGIHVPIGLYEDGNLVNTFDFYVVLPCHLGDVSNINSFVLGEGGLGMRSPRGAMIVDSLILADNAKYTISTTDCDLNTPGNQAYLPCIILSMGNIRGGVNTTISVDGNKQDAGVGGGGGGGAFCDNSNVITVGDENLRGGNGFTGGGIGGINNKGILGNGYYSNLGGGIGSGSIDSSLTYNYNHSSNHAGSSLNGVRGVICETTIYEAAGGGTGHPFGISGLGCNDGSVGIRDGAYGGGSGSTDQKRGGHAAYNTNGSSSLQNDGKIHGNKHLIPLAGGSGGASGNPNGTILTRDDLSGYGGGGGGAISLYSYLNNEGGYCIYARGANGGAGTSNKSGNGGSGSGGGIIVSSKLNLSLGTLDVSGGYISNDTAGSGYIRAEAVNNLNFASSLETTSSIIVTDTSSYVDKSKTLELTGSGNGNLYYKRENNDRWFFLASVTGKWKYTITDDIFQYNGDTLFYIAAVQENNRISGTYHDEPAFLMSQAGANILKVELTPYIVVDENKNDLKLRVLNCPDTKISIDAAAIFNNGDADLVLWTDKITQLYDWGTWEYDNPINCETDSANNVIIPNHLRLADGDTAKVNIKLNYTIPADLKGGIYYDTLTIWHNDTVRENPYKLPIEITVYDIELHTLDADFKPIDTLDIGAFCKNENIDSTFHFLVENDEAAVETVQVKDVYFIDESGNLVDSISVNFDLKPSDIKRIEFNISNLNGHAGTNYLYCIINVKECDAFSDTLVIKYFLKETELTFDKNPLNFGKIRLGKDSVIAVTLTNQSNYDVTLRREYFKFAKGDICSIIDESIQPALPTVIRANEDLKFMVKLDASLTSMIADVYDTLIVELPKTNENCENISYLYIEASIVGNILAVNKNMVDFGTIDCTNKVDSIWIVNQVEMETAAKIDDVKIINQIPDNSFRIIQGAEKGTVLQPGDSVLYVIETIYNPANRGNDDIKGTFFLASEGDTIVVNLKYGVDDDIEILRTNIYCGDIPIGVVAEEIVTIRNKGIHDKEIINISLTGNNKVDYKYNNLPLVVPAKGEVNLIINVIPKLDAEIGEFRDTFSIATRCYNYENNVIYGSIIKSDLYFKAIEFNNVVAGCDMTNNSDLKKGFMINNGEAPVVVDEIIGIAGYDSNLFEILSSDELPKTLDKKDTFNIEVLFSSKGSFEGEKNAEILFKVIADGKIDTVRMRLIGHVTKGMIVWPNKPDFGILIEDQTENMSLKLENNTEYEFIVTDAYLKDGMQGFAIPANISGNISIDNPLYINIDFSAHVPYGDKYDTLCVALMYKVYDCLDTVYIPLHAVVTPKTELTFRVSTHNNVSPNLTNYDIPIYLKSTYNALDNLTIENIVLELDKTLFYPKSVNTGNINTEIDNNKRIVTLSNIKVNHINVNEEIELCRIRGDVLLGETDSTGIIVKDVKTSTEGKNIVLNGYLTIETCNQGGNRLVNYGYYPNVKVENNPVVNDIINVECDIVEQGEHYLSIVNYLGDEIVVKNWNVQSSDANRLVFAIPANDLCSGTYILVLTTPTKKYSTNIVIVR